MMKMALMRTGLLVSNITFYNTTFYNDPRDMVVYSNTANFGHMTYPTPIRYLGLLFGSRSVQRETVFQNNDFSSPPLRPPIAIPGVLRFTISGE